MSTGNWITIGIFAAVQIMAFIGYAVRESKRKNDIDWRLKTLEHRMEKAEDGAKDLAVIRKQLGTLITILREKDVVNGHPDLEG